MLQNRSAYQEISSCQALECPTSGEIVANRNLEFWSVIAFLLKNKTIKIYFIQDHYIQIGVNIIFKMLQFQYIQKLQFKILITSTYGVNDIKLKCQML